MAVDKKKLRLFLLFAIFILKTSGAPSVTMGVVLPHATFMIRPYTRTITDTLNEMKVNNNPVYEFMKRYPVINWNLVNISHVPSPSEILNCLCNKFLPLDTPVIIFVSNTEMFAEDTAAAQYFLQLVDYLGIPVIAWNAANSGFEKKMKNSVILQMAPSIEHQAAAMLDILWEYDYQFFAVLTSQIAGHNYFIQAIRDRMLEFSVDHEFTMLGHETLDVENNADLERRLTQLKLTETRIILLYATEPEANIIFKSARLLGLISKEYLWVVTQSVIVSVPNPYLLSEFPVGLIGVHFDTSKKGVLKTLQKAINIFGNGLELFHKDPKNSNERSVIKPKLSCSENGNSRWHRGVELYGYLKKVNFTLRGETIDEPDIPVEFNDDGTLKRVTLEIINLGKDREWQKIGTWIEGNLVMKGITWPSGDHTPPLGIPEKFHLRVTFLEEPPYLTMGPPDDITDECRNTDIECIVPPAKNGFDPTGVARNYSFRQCCTGFTVDLLRMLSNDLKFTFELNRVEDGLWGSELMNGKWNGLIAELVEHKADIAVTALKINSQRAKAVDFSVPFMDTGISIMVAKRTGIISPQAFLEPFDAASWFLILGICVQAAAFSIFAFEWLSPSGYNRQIRKPLDGHNFSLFRTFWLVWAMMFGAAVDVNCPRGLTARFMANVWAAFAVVFLAIYTANLAAFMITREEFYNLEGIEDPRLLYATFQQIPLRFGTIPFGNTDMILSANYPPMSRYMKKYSRPTVADGVHAVKKFELDAFIYDATVLDYLVGKDDECRLLTVGEWYAKTGYAIAFPLNSGSLPMFNDRILFYRSHGVLERLKEFWLAGACQQGKTSTHNLSFSYVSLTVDQFISAFVLLGAGIVLATILLVLERCYHVHVRKRFVRKGTRRNDLLALLSHNLARSLTFEEAVGHMQVQQSNTDETSRHKCRNPLCDALLWKARREMDIHRLNAEALENRLLQIQLNKPDRQSDNKDKPRVENERNLIVPDSKDKFYFNQWSV